MSKTKEKKPQRIKGDPKGYELAFDSSEAGDCPKCAFHGSLDNCVDRVRVCSASARPENRGVHYVKKATRKAPKVILPPGHVYVADCPGRFLVLEGMKNDGTVDLKDLAGVRGPFVSAKAAEDDIRKDAVDTFEGDPESTLDDLENWGSDCLIVEVKRVVRPVPVVSVKAEIKTIAGG